MLCNISNLKSDHTKACEERGNFITLHDKPVLILPVFIAFLVKYVNHSSNFPPFIHGRDGKRVSSPSAAPRLSPQLLSFIIRIWFLI
jgi:hypothetical protein